MTMSSDRTGSQAQSQPRHLALHGALAHAHPGFGQGCADRFEGVALCTKLSDVGREATGAARALTRWILRCQLHDGPLIRWCFTPDPFLVRCCIGGDPLSVGLSRCRIALSALGCLFTGVRPIIDPKKHLAGAGFRAESST
jgi:hypothetical protein